MNKLAALFLWSTFVLCLNAQITLGPTVSTFGVLGGSAVTNGGPSVITGNLGVSPGTAITGVTGIAPGGPGTVVGTIDSADAVSLQAQNELTTAFNAAAASVCGTDLTGQNLGGLVLTPGVYCFSTSAQLTGNLILNALNNSAGQFIFKIGSTLTAATGSGVIPINAALPANIFWEVGSSASLGTSASFSGNILAQASISLGTGAILQGRALARTGAVTLLSNIITSPAGPGVPPGAPGTPGAPLPAAPAPSSLILVATALVCAGIYQARGYLLKPFRRN